MFLSGSQCAAAAEAAEEEARWAAGAAERDAAFQQRIMEDERAKERLWRWAMEEVQIDTNSKRLVVFWNASLENA